MGFGNRASRSHLTPQFLAAGEARRLMRMLEWSAAFMVTTFAVFVVDGVFAATVATAS